MIVEGHDYAQDGAIVPSFVVQSRVRALHAVRYTRGNDQGGETKLQHGQNSSDGRLLGWVYISRNLFQDKPMC